MVRALDSGLFRLLADQEEGQPQPLHLVVLPPWAGAVSTVASASGLALEPGHEPTFVLAHEHVRATHEAGKRVDWGCPDTNAEAGFERPLDEKDAKET